MSPRTANKKADAIFTADMHLRLDTPECRTDDYRSAQARKVAWLAGLQVEHGCPVIDAGDVFDHWKVEPELEGWAIRNLPAKIITVPGNHDLPQHSLKLYEKSSLHVLEAAGTVKVLRPKNSSEIPILQTRYGTIAIEGFPYGEEIIQTVTPHADRRIAVVHAYVAETVPAFIADGWTPAQLLAALPGYDVIVGGHNHMPLVYEHKGHLVINPGSMMRATADQADHRPRAYLWYADTNTVEPAYFPIELGAVSRAHLAKAEERDARLAAFVNRLDAETEVGLSFEQNLERYLAANAVGEAVRDMVWEAVGGH